MARYFLKTLLFCSVVSLTIFADYARADVILLHAPTVRKEPIAEDVAGCATPERWNSIRTTYNKTTVEALDSTLSLSSMIGLSSPQPPAFVPGKLNQTATIDPQSSCVNHVGVATYYGHRVNQDADNSVVALYDKNGIIAGMQVRFRQAEVLVPGNTYKFTEIPMFQNETIYGIHYFVMTAYFVDPAIICETGRTPDELNRLEGTGNILYVQNGRTPSELVYAPRHKKDAIRTGFSNNECFPAMGYHSFLNVSQWSMENCDLVSPLFLLYSRCGDLLGFGLTWIGHSVSERFEHPSPFSVSAIMGADQTPQCVMDAANRETGGPGITAMHAWFVDRNPECPITGVFSSLAHAVSRYVGF